MSEWIGPVTGIILPVVTIASVFTFIAVVSWSENRRREREAYYRSETLRKAIEQGGESAQMVLGMMREEEARQMRRRIDGLRLGGLVTSATGIGIMILLYFVRKEEPVWLAGVMILLIGVVIAAYGFLSKPESR